MSNLLKLADRIESDLLKLAAQHVLTQLNELVSAAYATFQFKPEVKKMVDSGDMYGQETVKSLHNIMERIYFGASGMRHDAMEKGLSKGDMEARKNRILALCNQAINLLQANGVGSEAVANLGLNVVKAKTEALVPVNLPALQPKAAPPAETKPAETGVAYTEEDLAAARQWYSEPTDEELQGALDLLRPKDEWQQSGIKQFRLKDVPKDLL